MSAPAAPPPPQPGVRPNAFDLLRLLAAGAVLVEHSWVLTGHPSPLPTVTGTSLGRIGVGVFFLVSGFLVASSWRADPCLRRFALRRALRIYPAYLCVLLLTVLVLGPAVTTLPPVEYLTSSGTWLHLLRNALVVPVDYALPGVFETVPEPGAVNGSLWTIRVEVSCYLLVALLGLTGLLRLRSAAVLLCVAGLGLATAVELTGYEGALVPGALAATAAEPLAYFAIGLLVRGTFPRSRLGWPAALGVVALWVLAWGTPVAVPTSVLAVSALTVAIAFRSPAAVHHPTGRHDLSYGIYLMSYPVQQTMALLGARDPLLVLGATALVVGPLALLSWLLVERPALSRKPVPARHGGGIGVPSS